MLSRPTHQHSSYVEDQGTVWEILNLNIVTEIIIIIIIIYHIAFQRLKKQGYQIAIKYGRSVSLWMNAAKVKGSQYSKKSETLLLTTLFEINFQHS